VRRGNVVAFGLPGADRERVVVAAEVRAADDAEAIRAAVGARILEALALRVDEVLLLPPGSLPKTSSGKLQRARTVELYRRGELGRVGDAPGALGMLRHLAASRWGYVKASLARRPEGG
jgi:fatty-acyl-CoA synthase